MRVPRAKFKLWMLLIAVAVVALALGMARMVSLRSTFLRMAAEYAIEEQDEIKILRTLDRHILRLGTLADEASKRSLKACAETRANRQAWADHYAQMKQKYESAASRPWAPVAPDTPPLLPDNE